MPSSRQRELSFSVGFIGDRALSELVAQVCWLEECGLISRVWLGDERFHQDVWVGLAACACHTSTIGLGTCVTDPFVRHPALTANAIASLDQLSGGRAALGMGAGLSGFDALGIHRVRPATALRESTQLLRLLFASQGPITFAGELIRFHNSHLFYAARPDIPIYIAGRGPDVLRTASQWADGVIVATFSGGQWLEYALDRVAQGEAGRDSSLGRLRRIAWVYFASDSDADKAHAAVREGIAVALWGSRTIIDRIGIKLNRELQDFFDSQSYSFTPDVISRAAALVPDEFIADLSVSGTPTDCARTLVSLSQAGFDEIAIWPFPVAGHSINETIRRFIADVIPAVTRERDAGSMSTA